MRHDQGATIGSCRDEMSRGKGFRLFQVADFSSSGAAVLNGVSEGEGGSRARERILVQLVERMKMAISSCVGLECKRLMSWSVPAG